MSKKIIGVLLLGQLLSLAIAVTAISSGYLAQNLHWSFPTIQSFPNYFLLFLVYYFEKCPLTRNNFPSSRTTADEERNDTDISENSANVNINTHTTATVKPSLWLYFLLAFLDVEANFLLVMAYRFTSILSVTILDGWTVPCIMLINYLMRKFWGGSTSIVWRWQILGSVTALFGLGIFIGEDLRSGRLQPDQSGRDESWWHILMGDLLVILGATMYSGSNILQEYLIKLSTANGGLAEESSEETMPIIVPSQEHITEQSLDRSDNGNGRNGFDSSRHLLGRLGLFASIISAVQAVATGEVYRLIRHTQEMIMSWPTIMCFAGFVAAMFCLYSLTPTLLRKSSAGMLNISLLTSDFYVVIWSVWMLGFQFTPVYVLAFGTVISGLLLYNLGH